jgi:hypothetical protein
LNRRDPRDGSAAAGAGSRLDPPRVDEHADEALASPSRGEIDELTGRGLAIRALGHAYPHG